MNVVSVATLTGSEGKAGKEGCLIKVASLFVLCWCPLFPAQVLNQLGNNAEDKANKRSK